MDNNYFTKLRSQIQKKFDDIRECLRVREKLLLRQVDLLLHSKCSSSQSFQVTEFSTDTEEELLKLIRNYGKFDYDSINLAFSDIFKNEDDNDPQIDHDTMYKCIEECAIAQADLINANDEQIVVDFSANRRLLRDSIINITVKETKELVESQQRIEPPAISPLDLSSISPTDTSSTKATDDRSSKSSQTEVPAKKKRSFRPKITINNCNGIINLRNIANLTINCAKESSIRKEKSPRNDKSNKTDEETVTSTTKEDIDGNCEFYERLLNEIKNSLLLKKTRTYPLPLSEEEEKTPVNASNDNEDVLETPDSTNDDICIEKTASKFVLKNFENLKIILENVNGTDLQPVQIEQWLAEIVSETEIEPNIGEIFEHSEISS